MPDKQINSKPAKKSTKWSGKKIALLIVILLLIILVGSCLINVKKQFPVATGFLTATVERGTIEQTIEGTGTLQPSERFVLKNKTGGTVEDVFVNEGSQVKAGDPILQIKNNSVTNQREQATIQWDSAQKDYHELLNPASSSSAIRAAQLKVEQYQLALEDRKKQVKDLTLKAPFKGTILSNELSLGQEVKAGQKAVRFATAGQVEVVAQLDEKDISSITAGMETDIYVKGIGQNLQGKVKEVAFAGNTNSGKFEVILEILEPTDAIREGMQTYNTIFVVKDPKQELLLYKQGPGYIRYSQSDEMLTEVSGTVKEIYQVPGTIVYEGAPLVLLSNPELERQLKETQLQLENAEEDLRQLVDPDKVTIDQQRLKVLQSQESYLSATEKAESLYVVSPIDGVVVSLAVSMGEELSNSTLEQELVVVSSFQQTELTIAVDELDINKIEMGQEAIIKADALPGQNLTAKVIGIAYEGTTTNDITKYDVTLALDYTEGIKGGMSATAIILQEKKENVLLVPAEAVITVDGQSTIQVMVDGAPQNKPIKIGLSTDRWVEVTDGLQEGESIIVVSNSGNRSFEMMFGGSDNGNPAPNGTSNRREINPQQAHPEGR